MIDDFILLLEKLAQGHISNSERESMRAQLLRMISKPESDVTPFAPAQVGTDVDKLDGQHGSFYQDASNLNAGTLNTDRFSAYTDLGAESKIGAGATQVAAGNHAHAGVIQNPMTTIGDMIYQPGSYTVANADATGNKVINANPSSSEKIIPVCDLKIADPVGNITITWDAWVSMNQTGVIKNVTVRLRRDDLNGAILWSLEKQMATDSALGHDQQFNGSLTDTAVTTGRYVLTSTATGASVVDIYGDTRTFTIAGYTNTPSRLPIGTVAGHVLSVNAGATAPEWSNRGVTNGDSHDHNGGDGAQIDHVNLANKGTNTHAQVDTFIASKAAASGLASLDASSLVVQNPANATATSTASKIPIADASGKLDTWISTVAARYTTNAGQSIANATRTIVNFEDLGYDTHSAVTIGDAWKFTCPTGQGGYYRVALALLFGSSAAWGAGEIAQVEIWKGGAFYSAVDKKTVEVAVTETVGVFGCDDVYLAAGEYIDIRVYQNSGGALALYTDGGYNHVAISKV